MGNSNNQPNQSELNGVSSRNYKSTLHPHFRQAKILKDFTGQLSVENKQRFSNKNSYNEWMQERHDVLSRINCKYLYLPKTITQPETGFSCGPGTAIVSTMYYDFYPFCLDRQIEIRRSLNKNFQQVECWYILYTGLLCLAEFQRNNLKTGNLHPVNVLLNQRGHVRFANRFSWPGEYPHDYTKYEANVVLPCYAPEELGHGEYNFAKADCFGLAMTVAQLILYTDYFSDLYKSGFDFSIFQRIRYELARSKTSLSAFLKDTLLWMIEIDTKVRPQPSAVLASLKPYENQILEFRAFQALPAATWGSRSANNGSHATFGQSASKSIPTSAFRYMN